MHADSWVDVEAKCVAYAGLAWCLVWSVLALGGFMLSRVWQRSRWVGK